MMSDDREPRVVGTLRQAQQGFRQLACGVQLCPHPIKPPQPQQDREQCWRLAHLLTQRICLGVGVLHLGRCLPFRHQRGCTEGKVQRYGLLRLLRRRWQGLEQRNPGGYVADGFQVGRAVTGVFARPLPIVNRLLREPCLSGVMCQKLR